MTHSLTKRLIALSVLMSALLMGSWIVSSTYNTRQLLSQQKRQDVQSLLNRTTDYVNLYCEGLNTNLLALCSTLESMEGSEGQIQTLISGIRSSNPGKILSIACVIEDGKTYSNRATALEIFGNPYFQEFYEEAIASSRRMLRWSEPYISPLTAERTVALYKAVQLEGRQAVVIIEVNLSTMLSSILNTAGDSSLIWSVVSKGGNLVATSDDYNAVYNEFKLLSRARLEEELPRLMDLPLSNQHCEIDGTAYFFFRQAAMWNWSLLVFSRQATLTGAAQGALSHTLWLGVMHMVLLSLLLELLGHSYTRPIVRMAQRISRDDSPLQLSFADYARRSDEIGVLSRSIDGMIARIRRLSKEREAILQQQRLLEIDVLQGQIHPHFLGNTLACIQSLVKDGSRKEALDALVSLVRLLNYSIARTDATATLEDELNCARAYIALRKIRVTYAFDYQVYVPSSHLQHHVPRLILQPLIENAIVHGFAGRGEPGQIVVTSYLQSGKLFLCIDDNGQGATEERLRAVMEGSVPPSEHSHGIGVQNVFKRLKLNDPEPNSCRIMRNADGGVRVLLDLGRFTPPGNLP